MAQINKKRRFAIVGGIIVIVMIVAIAVIGAGTSKTVMTIAQASQSDAIGQRVKVTGTVVDDSYSIEGDTLTFSIYDPDASDSTTLQVRYDQGVSATFGNGVVAICGGTIAEDGTLECTSLVTKCPSKYETATNALSVSKLLSYGDSIISKTVKVQGIVAQGTLRAATSEDERFTLLDEADISLSLPVEFGGALSESIEEGSSLVITGALEEDGFFSATYVAEEA